MVNNLNQEKDKENISPPNDNENIENENEILKYLLHEEMECFNQILFDFNIQFNDIQSQEETLRRDILKKHKEIEKLNFDIDECRKQKDTFIKELQNIAVKLNEYRLVIPQNNINEKLAKGCKCEDVNTSQQNNTDSNRNSVVENEDDFDVEEFYLLLNADNKEYLIKKMIQENRKYKSIVKVMKTEEVEFNNYLMQLEAEIENFGKFKNFCMTKINTLEENLSKCRGQIDVFIDKINNIEFQLELADD